MDNDTICAPASAPLNSAISIIRISGSDSMRVANELFKNNKNIKPRYANYGYIFNDREEIDDVILIFYKSPHSYTGEDMVEIYCHGNPLIVNKIIGLLLSKGIRYAEPGEFTKRAFLNGKMDLTAAEAINHIIKAKSEWELKTAIKQKHGSFKNLLNDVKNKIIELKADIECNIDFIDQDIEIISNEESIIKIDNIKDTLQNIYERCVIGDSLSRGIDIIIIGKPNVGKSSFLNCILNNERAIVSDIPGTTRDIIKESVSIKGIQCNLYDTAGIRSDADGIELIGISKSKDLLSRASLIIFIVDPTSGFTEQDMQIYEMVSNKSFIVIINKIDLINQKRIMEFEKEIKNKINTDHKIILFSSKTATGIKDIEESIFNFVKDRFIDYDQSFIADLNMKNYLKNAISQCENVKKEMIYNSSPEIIAAALQEVIEEISKITGDISADDVLNSVFNRFCIGK